ncbi:MAG TPA: aldo/keto reductase [Chloroflexota bacterium]|jgi:aryl-alcohol dehydrogenase-like predicted oxidoreductase
MLPRVEYGQTGLLVSRVCVGTGAMGPGRHNLSPADGAAILRRALERGLNFWDTAPTYATHPHVREALAALRRTDVVVNTKTRAFDAAEATAELEQSLRELGVDYVDSVLLHAVSSTEDLTAREPALEALLQARERGLVRAVGLSTHLYTGELLNVLADRAEVQIVLALYNRDGLGLRGGGIEGHRILLERLHAGGKGVTAMKVVGDGALADQAVEMLRDALAQPFLTSVCVGVCRDEQVEVAALVAEDRGVPSDLAERAAHGAQGPWAPAFGRF